MQDDDEEHEKKVEGEREQVVGLGRREVTIGCRVELVGSEGTEGGGMRLPTGFEEEMGRSLAVLEGTDRLVVWLELAGEWPTNKQLERMLCRLYVLAEHHKALRDQLLVQVDIHIHGFSNFHRPDSSLCHRPLMLPHHRFHTLALGGTFDHLHSGHKILLTMAAWIASHRLIVGITDDQLLINKQHANRLQSLPERKQAVHDFLQRVGPLDLLLETPTLTDVYGPTAHDPHIDALLVSKETLPGAHAIDTIRSQNSLPPLHHYVVDVISNNLPSLPDNSLLKSLKISSTNIRAWLDSRPSSSPST